MQHLTLEQIRKQCELDADDKSEDSFLKLIGSAAEAAVANHLNRKLYVTEVPEDDSTGLVVTDNIRMAMLLMVGNLYENRESTVTGTIISTVPLAYEYLLNGYRIIPL